MALFLTLLGMNLGVDCKSLVLEYLVESNSTSSIYPSEEV
jgi:hypothetical protein